MPPRQGPRALAKKEVSRTKPETSFLFDSGERTRTFTPVRELDFESSASANSATPPWQTSILVEKFVLEKRETYGLSFTLFPLKLPRTDQVRKESSSERLAIQEVVIQDVTKPTRRITVNMVLNANHGTVAPPTQ